MRDSLKKFIQEEIGKKLLEKLPLLEPHFMLCTRLLFDLLHSIAIETLRQRHPDDFHVAGGPVGVAENGRCCCGSQQS